MGGGLGARNLRLFPHAEIPEHLSEETTYIRLLIVVFCLRGIKQTSG